MNKEKISRNGGPILIVLAAVLWAFDGVIRRYLYSLPPISIIFFEHLVGLVILLPFVYKSILKEKLSKKDVWLLLLISLLSGLLGTLWFTTALLKVHFISFSVVFLLQKLQPIFALTTATVFLKEKFDTRYIKWALIALVAAYFVTFKNGHVDLATGEGTIIAALYALGAAFAWGSSTTLSKMILSKLSFGISTFYRFIFTTLMAGAAIIVFGYHSLFAMPTFPQFGLFAVIAVSTGMVALLIYYKGLSKTPVHISTMLELAFPFIAILIDMKMYHTTLAVSQLLAAFALSYAIYQISQLQSHALSIKAH